MERQTNKMDKMSKKEVKRKTCTYLAIWFLLFFVCVHVHITKILAERMICALQMDNALFAVLKVWFTNTNFFCTFSEKLNKLFHSSYLPRFITFIGLVLLVCLYDKLYVQYLIYSSNYIFFSSCSCRYLIYYMLQIPEEVMNF